MGCLPRAHTPCLLPAGRTERIVGGTHTTPCLLPVGRSERIVCESCVCLAYARARGRTTCERAHRGRNTHMHVAGCPSPCPPVCGTTARTRRAAGGRMTPPQTAAHPLAAVVPEGGAPTPAADDVVIALQLAVYYSARPEMYA